MTREEMERMAAGITEKILADQGLAEAIRKIKFSDKKPGEMSKEEKTLRFLKAQMENDRENIRKYCGGVIYIEGKDLSGGTAGSGLELLPQEFHIDIIDRITRDPIALRNRCNVIPVSYRGGTWPVGVTGITMTWETSDTNPLTATNPTFGSLTYNVARLDGYTAIARDLLADTPVALYNYLVVQYEKAMVKAENTAIINGSGSSQPQGIRGAAGIISVAVATAGTTNVLAPDDVISLPFNVDVSWRDGGVYIVNTGTVKQMKLFKDSQNRYLWMDGDITKGVPPTFNGYPVLEFTSIFPENLTVNAKTTCTEMLFGNLEYYYLFDKMEMGSEVNTQSDQAFKNHEALIKMWERIDGKPAVAAAFAKLTGFLK